MKKNIFDLIPEEIVSFLKKQKIDSLMPVQEKAIRKGLFKTNKNMLVVSPTASGKTLIGELAMLNVVLLKKKKVIYILPLKALASEKYRDFQRLYGDLFRIKIAIGEIQNENYDYDFDLLLVTSEKLDSLIRHSLNILKDVGLLIVDEIHLLNDEKRGPTLEILLSIFKTKYKNVRIIGLSATIGNSKELSEWIGGVLIEDDFRPVELQHCVLIDNKLIRYK